MGGSINSRNEEWKLPYLTQLSDLGWTGWDAADNDDKKLNSTQGNTLDRIEQERYAL